MHYYINSHYKLLPHKYLELNKTKAIAGVSKRLGLTPHIVIILMHIHYNAQ